MTLLLLLLLRLGYGLLYHIIIGGSLAHRLKNNRKCGAEAHLALDINGAAHLLHDHLADGESESPACGIGLPVLLQIVEVYEEAA